MRSAVKWKSVMLAISLVGAAGCSKSASTPGSQPGGMSAAQITNAVNGYWQFKPGSLVVSPNDPAQ